MDGSDSEERNISRSPSKTCPIPHFDVFSWISMHIHQSTGSSSLCVVWQKKKRKTRVMYVEKRLSGSSTRTLLRLGLLL